MDEEIIEIKAQPGFQEQVINCDADIAIVGGAAGAGKTFILLLESLINVNDPRFSSVYFRRTKETIRATGGLWDESKKWCPRLGGYPSESILKWRFPSGASIDFEGIEYEKDLSNWQGTQIPLIIFDELTEFTQKMFFFMFSRNRGICSIKPYIRASCNPDPDSWVANFLSWWIDQDTGYPIKERAGVIRYMINYKDQIVWGNTKEEVIEKCPQAFKAEKFLSSGIDPYDLIKSVTFIPGDIYDNKILLSNDPGYLGSLNSMDDADQDRFLNGNWKVRSDGMGLYEKDAIDKLFIDKDPEKEFVLTGYNKGTPIYKNQDDWRNKYISCDAAKFGRDLCVICVWEGWRIIHTTIFFRCDPHEIKTEIETLRVQFNVQRNNVIVDQDGVGGDTVKLGRYCGFSARREVAIDPDTRIRENYKMRKDQCYYHSADRVNRGDVSWIVTASTIKIYDKGSTKPRFSRQIKWKGIMVDVTVLIKNHLRSIKRGATAFEGGEKKLCTNSKEEQKEILDGDSPDFADTMMMREDFELTRRRAGGFKVYE